MRCEDRAARMIYQKCTQNVCPENLEVRHHSKDLGVDRRTILELILKKQARKVWTGFIWLRMGTSGGLLWTR